MALLAAAPLIKAQDDDGEEWQDASDVEADDEPLLEVEPSPVPDIPPQPAPAPAPKKAAAPAPAAEEDPIASAKAAALEYLATAQDLATKYLAEGQKVAQVGGASTGRWFPGLGAWGFGAGGLEETLRRPAAARGSRNWGALVLWAAHGGARVHAWARRQRRRFGGLARPARQTEAAVGI